MDQENQKVLQYPKPKADALTSLITGNKVPLYHQVALSLKQRVRTGVYESGKSLPSFRALSEEFGVSLKVIQQAIRHLEDDGIVVTHHGKGMMLMEKNPCEQAAIVFGFIQPYEAHMPFESLVLRYAEKVFWMRNNFMVACSSERNSSVERKVAEHLVNNGIKGIILWPEDNDPNGKFFSDLAKKVPVIIVDRELEDANLPTVIHDSYQAGQDVCQHMLETVHCQRMLVLMDNLKISPYRDFVLGLQDQAKALKRVADITIVQLPVSELCRQFGLSDFSQVDTFKMYIERLLREGGYDVVFCPQDEIIDYVVLETGLFDQFPGLQLGAITSPGANRRSRKYVQSRVIEWVVDHPKAISLAADLLQQWVFTRHHPRNVPKIKIERRERK